MQFARYIPVLLGVLFWIAAPPADAQTPFRPIATVNKSIITAYDIDQRMRILAVLGAPTEDTQALSNLALDRLIEDRLKVQAAESAGIQAGETMVDDGLSEFASQRGTSAADLRTAFSSAGVDDQALGDLVKSQMLWREVVQQRFRSRVEPGEADIDAEIGVAGAAGGLRFRLQEIGLPYDADGRTEAETRVLADSLFAELSDGGDFVAAVRAHSKAPSAANAGTVGWVDAEDLPPGIVAALAALEPGQVAPPQAVQGGVALLKVLEVDRATTGGADPQDPALRESVRRSLMAQRMELLAQGYIQELRREAMIELR